MNNSLQFLDILVFAMVAGFLLLRLHRVLGKRTGNEDQSSPVLRDEQQTAENVVTMPVASGTGAENGEDDVDSSATGLERIKIADPSFDKEKFLEGAKTAFEMILDAFSKADKNQLQNLLDATTYQSFHDEIERRNSAGERLETTLVSIILADIAHAEMLQSTARVTVKIISEQVSVTRDELEEVVSGDPSRVETIRDLWCFARDTRSEDPNWKLVETKPDDQ